MTRNFCSKVPVVRHETNLIPKRRFCFLALECELKTIKSAQRKGLRVFRQLSIVLRERFNLRTSSQDRAFIRVHIFQKWGMNTFLTRKQHFRQWFITRHREGFTCL